MAPPEFLACDWGTTNLRAWVLDDVGNIIRHSKFPLGVSKLAPGEACERFRTEIRPAMDARQLPALLCGMVGSTLGWTVVPYCPCPGNLAAVSAGMVQVDTNPATWIVPGLSGLGIDDAPDVMRGEETQVLGWIAAEPARASGKYVVCHPGTHSKWIMISNGWIVRFVTAMTGELFELLRTKSILRAESSPDDEEAFDQGLQAAGDGNALAARLFTTRARYLTGDLAGSPTSYLSGLLIGAEIASVPTGLGIDHGLRITLLGDPQLCRWYRRAMSRVGVKSSFSDGEGAVIMGLLALKKQMTIT